MKSTGIVRHLDELGRIVLPRELRKSMGIEAKDLLEIFTEGDRIVLQKYTPSCVFCDGDRDVREVLGKRVCAKCAKTLKDTL
jgi:transcriptional pleiotropic regulator of transition state genes